MKRRKEADHQAIVDEMSTPRHASSGCIVSHPLEAQGWVAPTGDRRDGKGVYVATAEGVAAWVRHSAEVAA